MLVAGREWAGCGGMGGGQEILEIGARSVVASGVDSGLVPFRECWRVPKPLAAFSESEMRCLS